MKNVIQKIIETEATTLGLSIITFREYIEKGCILAYRKGFDDLTNSLININPEEDELRNLILACAYGGMIESSIIE